MLAIYIIIFCSSFIQGLTGFGFALIATPFLLHFLPSSSLIYTYISISLILNGYLYLTNKSPLIKTILKPLLLGGFLGLPLGFILLQLIPQVILKHFTGIFILVFLLLLLIKRLNLKPNKISSVAVGFLVGVLQTSIGVNGPPLVLYLNSLNHSPHSVKKTLNLIFFCLSLFSLIISLPIIKSYAQTITLSLVASPGIIIGAALGHRLTPRLKNLHLKFIINLLIALSALSLVLN